MNHTSSEITWALGRVVVTWGTVTWAQEQLFAFLTGLEDEFVLAALYHRIRDKAREDTCFDLAGQLEAELRDDIRTWLRETADLRQTRNDLLHNPIGGSWSNGVLTMEQMRRRFKPKLGETSKERLPLSMEALKDFEKEAIALCDHFMSNLYPRMAEYVDQNEACE